MWKPHGENHSENHLYTFMVAFPHRYSFTANICDQYIYSNIYIYYKKNMNAANAMKNRSTQCLQTPMVKLRAMDRVGFPWISHIPHPGPMIALAGSYHVSIQSKCVYLCLQYTSLRPKHIRLLYPSTNRFTLSLDSCIVVSCYNKFLYFVDSIPIS